ncbi:ATP-dependent DNA helicase RecG [Phyllobacterium myrsinacearum]|uniref:ATP-dependent DNA helicase RecG n=3 Tax=Pseudomonadota TaxID=1224 RepID=A0A2S9JYU1_9HYPH|nr:ATP-dependent DNA helicase RecG [Phyllobacterium myrsinacearum]PRD58515.1 ATP-dependent DNA helicase RecG [Phyllobacterium myrsinacearum]PWV96758.1 ATP-dependent DNA helicase RecG [Phyllobacterium myrsinacearum]RZV09250.1 ATP-dependent DNA helicase RecG [Phyllobacterium myrsinacearum]
MRPSLLDPLFASVRSLPGIGPKVTGLLATLLGTQPPGTEPRVGNLVYLPPNSVIDRRNRPGIAHAPEGAIVTLEVRIDRHQPAPSGRSNVPHRVFAHDDTGEIGLVFFHAKRPWLENIMPVGETVIVSGRIEWFNGRPSMVHPDHIAGIADAASLPLVEPVYPLTAGLSPKVLARGIHEALARTPEMPEWIEAPVLAKHGFPAHRQALETIHRPQDPSDIALDHPARQRLAYDEFLAGQLALALVRLKTRRLSGRKLEGDGSLKAKVIEALPYDLTGSQQQAIKEIIADLRQPERMLRLLQGDVGSGKTIVGLLAMAHAAESGGQSALMVPTEVLARQHYATIAPLAAKAGLRTALLTGREKGREREDILDGLRSGAIHIVIGTHALFQEKVNYHDLVFVIIDEQHRFGVHQRLLLQSKGSAPDMLVMTATPIPRTLVLTAFGDMDVSKLTEKPAGRRPITTAILPMERLSELVDRMRRAIADGQKIYWICPLVEESELVDLVSAEERFQSLQPLLGNQIGLVHGRMTGAEKDAAMLAFKNGETRLLIATTVIEVGVDVPDATIIVIEHAERFGLAQLHQLRGRVGRGDKPSTCLLLYKGPLGDVARARLEIMRETEDGFRIAEEDLKLRGEGELLGTRQSGTPGFRLASIEAHQELLEIARKDARYILGRDPELQSARGEALRVLLYLFERDEAVRLLRAG